MDVAAKKEQFNVAYVHALASQAGLNVGSFQVDNDSVDMIIAGKGYGAPAQIRNPQIQLQLKCTSQQLVNGPVLKFRLSRKNYDDLRGEDLVCPRYLVVLVVPDDHTNWIEHLDDCMKVRNACYWVSIRHHPASLQESETVDVPLTQRLTAMQLRTLIDHASNGVAL